MSTGLQVDIETTNRLSHLLDQQRSDIVEVAAQINDLVPSVRVLSQLLSLQSVISTASSLHGVEHSIQNKQIGYRKIGFGQCGLIFERPGHDFVVKVSRPFFEEALWNDFLSHLRVYKAFAQQKVQPECRVPLLFSYIPRTNVDWWNANKPYFPDNTGNFPLPAMALISEHILPLSRPIRNALIDQFCPETLKASVKENPANRDCLARVYLGRRRPANSPPPPNFGLRNYNLCLDQMLDLDLPVEEYATAMAESLAIIHWTANVDGYDIEFVLGSEIYITYTKHDTDTLVLQSEALEKMHPHPDLEAMIRVNSQTRTTRMWVLDFNLCNRWTEETLLAHSDEVIDQLVLAFFENDPYYPLPLMELDVDKKLWSTFRMEYLRKSEEILLLTLNYEKVRNLPAKFMDACMEREQKKLAEGLGHGHRDLKG